MNLDRVNCLPHNMFVGDGLTFRHKITLDKDKKADDWRRSDGLLVRDEMKESGREQRVAEGVVSVGFWLVCSWERKEFAGEQRMGSWLVVAYALGGQVVVG